MGNSIKLKRPNSFAHAPKNITEREFGIVLSELCRTVASRHTAHPHDRDAGIIGRAIPICAGRIHITDPCAGYRLHPQGTTRIGETLAVEPSGLHGPALQGHGADGPRLARAIRACAHSQSQASLAYWREDKTYRAKPATYKVSPFTYKF